MSLPFTTPDAVRDIYPDIPPTRDAALKAAIMSASMLVKTSIIDNGCGANYTPEAIELITQWLSVHHYLISNGFITSKQVGAASESYQVEVGGFLLGTPHGQQAMLFDPNNCLAKLMADTELALQGKGSFAPSVHAIPAKYARQQQIRRC